MSWQQMDKAMADVAAQFPAKTAGHGGDRMVPKILADGTKEFDLEAKIVKWEVSPGKLVDAWTYNGVVPAPEIHVNDGDKVRLVLTNHLPESTRSAPARHQCECDGQRRSGANTDRRERPSPTSSWVGRWESTTRTACRSGARGLFTIDGYRSQVLLNRVYTKAKSR
jgi:FtsP/CotA-like multicopper oxidase with cupredoxin domain